jgi:hypothetical protein
MLGLTANRQHLSATRAFPDRNDRGFIYDDSAPGYVDLRIDRAEVNRNIVRKYACSAESHASQVPKS